MANAKKSVPTPKTGDCYICEECGMKLEITADCACDDAACVKLECCGEPMCKA